MNIGWFTKYEQIFNWTGANGADSDNITLMWELVEQKLEEPLEVKKLLKLVVNQVQILETICRRTTST